MFQINCNLDKPKERPSTNWQVLKPKCLVIIITRTYTQGPSLLCMNDVLGQLGEIGEIEQEGSDHKVANIIFFFVIIITRPKRAGSCGHDTVQAGTFWGVLNVLLCVSGALLDLDIVGQINFF